MACARAVTTTLAMLCALAVPEARGQFQLEPSPHRPQLQELQQLARLLENELQTYENKQNNPQQQQPWWTQQQHPYVPLHLQDQPDVVVVPGQQQLSQLQKQLENNFQGGLSTEQFGQRIKQRPTPTFQPQLPPLPPSQPLLYTPQFKPLPEPFRQPPWQPIQQTPIFQQPQSVHQSQNYAQPALNFVQPQNVQQSQNFAQPQNVQQSQNFQQPFIQQQPTTQPFQQPARPPTPVPLNLQQQPEVLDLSQLKQLVQLQQDIDQQREKQVRQRQQEQLLQQQQTPVQQRQPTQQQPPKPAQQKQPAKSTTPSPQQRQREKQRQQQQRQTNLIPATNAEKQPQKPSNTTEKPIKSVRDLFNTSSCVEPPFTCPHPRIQFYLYTRSTQENPKILDVLNPNSLRSSDFDPSLPIKVLIHGFQGGRNFSPSTDLRKAYFTRGGYNVIVVEYGSLVRLPCLNQVQWSPSFLAMCISQLVSYVGETSGIPPERFHLIGYSIGAHVAGLVANYVGDRKLGRITGLDPTIIFYQGSNKSHDLDPTDARFVDVIHTGAGILGQRGPNGHVDYYVNGGTTQPGCQSDSLIKTLSCDHTKVSPYYVESIVTPSGFWALPCPNYFMYLIGLCQPEDKDYILMGEDAPLSARGIYYVTTNAFKPYAKGWPGKGPKPKLPGRPS